MNEKEERKNILQTCFENIAQNLPEGFVLSFQDITKEKLPQVTNVPILYGIVNEFSQNFNHAIFNIEFIYYDPMVKTDSDGIKKSFILSAVFKKSLSLVHSDIADFMLTSINVKSKMVQNTPGCDFVCRHGITLESWC